MPDAVVVYESEEKKRLWEEISAQARAACQDLLATGAVKNQAALARELQWHPTPVSLFLAGKRPITKPALSLLHKKYHKKTTLIIPVCSEEEEETITENDVDTSEYFPVPVYEATGSMGGGSFENSRKIVSHISILKSYLRTKCSSLNNIGFILAVGDSMTPNIPPGAFTLVDTGKKDPINGKIYYVMYDNQYYIKRIEVNQGTITALISDKDLSRIEIGPDDNFEIIGMVLLQLGEL